jgi:hypothetical protein
MNDIEKAPPALFQHCVTVFEAMRAGALPHQIGTPGDSAAPVRHAFVYQGHTTRLFRELNLPSPYYTSILQALQQMGCIKQLSRGGGSAESRWELLDDPTMDLFFESSGVTPGKSRMAKIEQRLADSQNRLDAIEERIRLEETG